MHRLNLDDQPETLDNQASSTEEVQKTAASIETLDTTDTTTQNETMSSKTSLITKPLLIAIALAVVAGIATGFGGHQLMADQSSTTGSNSDSNAVTERVAGNEVKAGDVFGSDNTELFKDNPEGYIEAGGLDGEGSHKLLRPGGESQTVYLTSSVVDLDSFVGMEVKIWGETYAGQKAGWLMDVGRVEVIAVDGEVPTE